MTKKNRVLIIGLDGATWDVLDPLIKEGYLPNLGKLKEKGISGILKSNFPPVTGSAWMSIATGKNPGETGIFDFLVLENRKTWKLRPISSEDYRRNGAIWDYLSAKGLKVGVVNYPMLYPPYPINGVMISGLGAPEDGDIFYPPELKEKLQKSIGKHKIYVPFARPKYANPKYFIKDIEELINYNYRLADYLIDDTYDFFIFVISASDFLGHYGWHWWEDKNHKYHKTFKKLWYKIDEIVGLMVEKWGDGYVMVISDHGMGRVKECFLINKWLEKEKLLYLKTHKKRHKLIRVAMNSFKEFFLECFSKRFPLIADYLYVNFIKKRFLISDKIVSQVDLKKTKAFSLGHSGLGNIYINDSNNTEYHKLVQYIIERLKKFFRSQKIEIKVYSKSNLYEGSLLNMLPDIIFVIENNTIEVSSSLLGEKLFRKVESNKSGSHRIEGIFMIYPSGNLIENKRILKLTEIVKLISYLLEKNSEYKNTKELSLVQQKQHEYNDYNDIVNKLKDLGYL